VLDHLRAKIYSSKNKSRNYFYSILHWIYFSNIIQTFHDFGAEGKTIFTLDLHTSVVRDVAPKLKDLKIKVNRWSISGSSHLFNEPNLKTRGVRNSNWKSLDAEKISLFQKTYNTFLTKQKSFLITYSFSFIEMFVKYQKPILGINATRYESPFTFDEVKFNSLNQTLKNYSKLYVVSNNIADQEYLKHFAGLTSSYIPSLCDYSPKHTPQTNSWVVLSRNLTLGKKISEISKDIETQEAVWPRGYSYKEFSFVKGVILIPYNVSTMRLFELTTAGFPVRIPSDRLLMEWSSLPGVLSELSYAQVYGRDPLKAHWGSPMDPNWKNFYSWWLERADWNNVDLFPNISRFDSLEELSSDPIPFRMDLINKRNLKIDQMWKEYLRNFESKI